MIEVRRGVVRGFDAATHTASVEVVGSRSAYLGGIPVSRAVPGGEMVAGRGCVVVFFEPTDPADCMVVGVH